MASALQCVEHSSHFTVLALICRRRNELNRCARRQFGMLRRYLSYSNLMKQKFAPHVCLSSLSLRKAVLHLTVIKVTAYSACRDLPSNQIFIFVPKLDSQRSILSNCILF